MDADILSNIPEDGITPTIVFLSNISPRENYWYLIIIICYLVIQKQGENKFSHCLLSLVKMVFNICM